MPPFLHPTLLFIGLGCVAIPIIIHLLTRQRRQPIPWAAMRFIIEAYKRQRRRLTLEQLLLLAARCLLVALVAFAIARPLLSSVTAASRSARVVYILLDNALPSSLSNPDGTTPLDAHKQAAIDLLATLDPARGDRAGLILLGGPVDPAVVPASADIPAVRRLIEQATPTDSAADLDAAFSRLAPELAAAPADTPPVTISLHSEFLAGSIDTQRKLAALPARADAPPHTILISPPRDTPVANVSITGVEPLRPLILGNSPAGSQADDQVRVHLRRTGPATSQASTSLVKLRLAAPSSPRDAGASPDLASADAIAKWSPGDRETSVIISIPTVSLVDAGPSALIASIDRDAIASDNTFRRPVLARRAIQVALVTPPRLSLAVTIDRFEPADWLRLALSPQPGDSSPIRVVDLDPRAIAEPSALAGIDAVIAPRPDLLDDRAWTRLSEFVSSTGGGGLVILCTPPGTRAHPWLDQLENKFSLRVPGDREASRPAEPLSLRPDTSAALLALLSPELAELVKPVRVIERLRLDPPTDPSLALLTLSDNSPLLLIPAPAESVNAAAPSPRPPARGTILLFTAPFDLAATDLPARPLMLPLIQELVRQGVGGASASLASFAGAPVTAPPDAAVLAPIPSDAGPQIALSASPFAPRRAGLWRVQDSRGSALSLLAANADPRAADTSTTTREQVRAYLAAALPAGTPDTQLAFTDSPSPSSDPTNPARPAPDPRSPLPAWLLAAAALVGVIELALARIFSHARRLSPGLSASIAARNTSRTSARATAPTTEHQAA
ncbi:MAG: BatA domain-containing protein [Phycisphaerae bacterium]|nr:BatA domain-containing protein [Phycisphaerae bacterium]